MSFATLAGTAFDRARSLDFVRFGLVGLIGFATDALVLMIVNFESPLGPIWSRLISALIAVFVTFLLNRYWTFRDRRVNGHLSSFTKYLGVQAVGFLCNLGIYTLLIIELPSPLNYPVACLFAASCVTLLVNYTAARTLVFARHHEAPSEGESKL